MFGLHLEISPGVNSGNAKGERFTRDCVKPGDKNDISGGLNIFLEEQGVAVVLF